MNVAKGEELEKVKRSLLKRFFCPADNADLR